MAGRALQVRRNWPTAGPLNRCCGTTSCRGAVTSTCCKRLPLPHIAHFQLACDMTPPLFPPLLQLCYDMSSLGVINIVLGSAMLLWSHLVWLLMLMLSLWRFYDFEVVEGGAPSSAF